MLKLKIGAKVMLRVNVDMQDRIINGQTRNISHIKFDQGIVRKTYVKFYDEKASLKAMKSSYLGRKKFLGSYLKCDSNKERISITIHYAHSISFNISMGIYCS